MYNCSAETSVAPRQKHHVALPWLSTLAEQHWAFMPVLRCPLYSVSHYLTHSNTSFRVQKTTYSYLHWSTQHSSHARIVGMLSPPTCSQGQRAQEPAMLRTSRPSSEKDSLVAAGSGDAAAPPSCLSTPRLKRFCNMMCWLPLLLPPPGS